MKLDTIGTLIATRELLLSDAKKITVKIGKPKKFPDGKDYYCPYQIKGLGDGQVRYAGGVDAIQAFQLTLTKIGTVLYTSDEAKAGQLKWNAGQTKGDFGFPVPDVLRDLLPK